MSFSPRQSPFKRTESPVPTSPSTVRAATPTMSSPTKGFQSPMLSPERQSPFARRPSQLGSKRPESPFARPASRLSVAETPEPETRPSFDPFTTASPSPAERIPPPNFDGLSTSAAPILPPPTQTTTLPRPAYQRTTTSSTAGTVRPAASRPALTNISGYNNIPQPLLRSMRESFEVLDNSNTGAVSSADVASLLEQLGMDNNPRALSSFFPSNGPSTLNLARFLDTLAGPMSELSPPEELMAAFAAFDVDDSGQIDVGELRDALIHAPTEGRGMSEREIDGVMSEFSGRRAFGGKGVLGKDIGGGKRGDVFRYRDFMANISGTGLGQEGVPA